jgi:hypothetical protein
VEQLINQFRPAISLLSGQLDRERPRVQQPPRIILRCNGFASARNFDTNSSLSLGKDSPFEVFFGCPTMWSAIGIAAVLLTLSQP